MSDVYRTVQGKSWFARIASSVVGVGGGILLILVMIGVLFWNEGRAVKTRAGLNELQETAVELPAPKLQSDNDGKPVHFIGPTVTGDVLRDTRFDVAENAIRLDRVVEMYQWSEEKKSATRNKLGGGQETVTEYSYRLKWHEGRIDSSSFQQSGMHHNPPLKVEPQVQFASSVTVGDFKLSDELLRLVPTGEALSPKSPGTAAGIAAAAAGAAPAYKISGNWYYIGENPDAPALGDTRVKFQIVRPGGNVSVLATQRGNDLTASTTSNGKTFLLLMLGHKSKSEMIQHEQRINTMILWALRAGGYLAITLGFLMILAPLRVVADVVPFVGRIVGAGLLVISLLLSAVVSLTTIAIGWLFYRPVVSAIALGIVIVAIWTIRTRLKRATPEAATAPPAPPGFGSPPPLPG